MTIGDTQEVASKTGMKTSSPSSYEDNDLH